MAGLAVRKPRLLTSKAGLAVRTAGLTTSMARLAGRKARLATPKAGLAGRKVGLATSMAGLADRKAGLATSKGFYLIFIITHQQLLNYALVCTKNALKTTFKQLKSFNTPKLLLKLNPRILNHYESIAFHF
ncbi:hypothetical protein [Marinifilum flexuosum]|uniref:hypothetical protein n=1 Tax=Marinifilum flexuosum TaxID=1117708 RepID=UPI0024925F4D|nr:hypothetical protein [Marinifilum flexuosum]